MGEKSGDSVAKDLPEGRILMMMLFSLVGAV